MFFLSNMYQNRHIRKTGTWAHGLDVWTLDDWILDAWTLDAWILDDRMLGLWTPGRLDSERQDAWTLDVWTLDDWILGPRKLFPILVVCISYLLLFNVKF